MTSAYDVMRVASNIVSLLLFLIMAGILETVLDPYKRGFYCDDESIKYPYLDKQTVPTSLLLGLLAAVVFSVVILAELFNYYISKTNYGGDTGEEDAQRIKICNVPMRRRIYRPLANLVMIGIGFCICLILTGIGKRMIGRLRPHFIDACQPDYSRFNCSSGYITLDVCTQKDEHILKEARLSFPSGHASSSMYTATLFALYIQYMCRSRHYFLAITLAQVTFVSLGVACSLSRVSDYMHHWSDVLAGGILGSAIAFYTIYIIMRLPDNCDLDKRCRTNEMSDVERSKVSDDIECQATYGST